MKRALGLILVAAGMLMLFTPYVQQAVIEVYAPQSPTVTWTNLGTADSPAVALAGTSFTPQIKVQCSGSPSYSGGSMQGYIDGRQVAIYIDGAPPEMTFSLISINLESRIYECRFYIVFVDPDSGDKWTLDYTGYVKGTSIQVKWYLVTEREEIDLSALGTYEVKRVPAGPMKFKMVPVSGGEFISNTIIKIWTQDQTLGRGVEYENLKNVAPKLTLTLTKASDGNWYADWNPTEGVYIVYGFVYSGSSEFRTLSIVLGLGRAEIEKPIDWWTITGLCILLIGATLIIQGRKM
ncbi:hypothetical protein DRO69_14595 [Candidatus Bathyarchaeota archaeon]|nr:MAG: hypothetical protein DRO69_14595 [Candidatus Bathyarchaeota archaeon]